MITRAGKIRVLAAFSILTQLQSASEQPLSLEEQIALLDRHMQQLDEEQLGVDTEATELMSDIGKVEKWLRRVARLGNTAAERYAAALAEQGFGSLAFISQGEFSRRSLIQSFGILPGHAAPILRAIQALPPPPPLPVHEIEGSGNISDEKKLFDLQWHFQMRCVCVRKFRA